MFESCKRILDTWKSFSSFCALDMAATWAGPGLFSLAVTDIMDLRHQSSAMCGYVESGLMK